MATTNPAADTDVFVHPSSIVDAHASIGPGTRIWHFCHVMSGARIGRDCSLGQNCFVASGVVIGNSVKIQNNVSLYDGVVLADHVFCGPSMVFTNVINPRSAIERRSEFLPTRVGTGVTIGANATIVCGHSIGAYAFIGAGAVVVADVPEYALILGVPGRVAGWMSRTGQRLEFGPTGLATCSETGEVYQLLDETTVRCLETAPHQTPLIPQGATR